MLQHLGIEGKSLKSIKIRTTQHVVRRRKERTNLRESLLMDIDESNDRLGDLEMLIKYHIKCFRRVRMVSYLKHQYLVMKESSNDRSVDYSASEMLCTHFRTLFAMRGDDRYRHILVPMTKRCPILYHFAEAGVPSCSLLAKWDCTQCFDAFEANTWS